MTESPDEFFDLDAAANEQRAKRKPWNVLHRGQRFTMGNAFNLDLELLERAENGDISAVREALTLGLGDQYDAFRTLGLDLTEITILFEKWIERSGATPGESVASSDSSESTERPSKPTSTGSTESVSPQRFSVTLPTDTPPVSFS